MMPNLQSLPVAFGSETAKWICVGAIDITQISVAGKCLMLTWKITFGEDILLMASVFVAGYLLGSGKPLYALALLGLIAPQVFFQVLWRPAVIEDPFLE